MAVLLRRVCVLVLTMCVIHLSGSARTEMGSPCPDCYFFNKEHPRHPAHEIQSEKCRYPCECPVRELNCDPGVSMMMDGCGCCYMCTRQHGDLCNIKDKCDTKKGLYCDMSKPAGPGTGLCKAKVSKPCYANGKTYMDGAKFNLGSNCALVCTCQNGNYGCADICPDQYRVPSSAHCSQPRLMTVKDQCCKQWTCDVTEQRRDSEAGISPRHVLPSNQGFQELRMPSPSKQENAVPKSYAYSGDPTCSRNESAWGRCSTECGIGVSVRSYTDTHCDRKEETRLCYIRPCNTSIPVQKSRRCTPTARLPQKQRVRYQDCISVHELNFKFCTNCKTRRCCYPRKEKTRHIEFECGDGRRQSFAFMWIKSCRCDRKCYKKDPQRRKKSKKSFDPRYMRY